MNKQNTQLSFEIPSHELHDYRREALAYTTNSGSGGT